MGEKRYLDVDALATTILQARRASPLVLVGIDGAGGSGKSTLAALLAERIDQAGVVPVDDFYLPSAVRDSRAGEVGARFDLPRVAEQVVWPAATGSAVRYQRYDWDADQVADWIEIEAGRPIIVEGVYSLQLRLRESYSYTVFCRATPDVRLRRGLDRDGEDARSRWVDEWMPAEDSYLDAERPDAFADLVVDSSVGVHGAPVHYVIDRWRPAAIHDRLARGAD